MAKFTNSKKNQSSVMILVFGASFVWNNLGHFSKKYSNIWSLTHLWVTKKYIISIPDPRNWSFNIHTLSCAKHVCLLMSWMSIYLITTVFLWGIKGWNLCSGSMISMRISHSICKKISLILFPLCYNMRRKTDSASRAQIGAPSDYARTVS